MDRGFLDGQDLWWLHEHMGIQFYIPAKRSLAVYKDALSLIETGVVQTRQRKRTVGAGKNKKTVMDSWKVEGLQGLTSAGFYGEQGSGSHENRKDFLPNPINAVVVLDEPYRQNNPKSDPLVILTNAPVDKPITVYDGYDARSEIENGQFREAKQAWFIDRPARNTAARLLLPCLSYPGDHGPHYCLSQLDGQARQTESRGKRNGHPEVP